MKADDEKGLSIISFYIALLFALLGAAGRMKAEYHYRSEIETTCFIVAAVLVGLGIVLFLLSLRKRRG